MYDPSGQLRGGEKPKISPLSTTLAGGDGVQNQLSSRATASAPLAMLPSNRVYLRVLGAPSSAPFGKATQSLFFLGVGFPYR